MVRRARRIKVRANLFCYVCIDNSLTQDTIENIEMEATDSTDAMMLLIRQQLHDMAGQLLTLTERMYSLGQEVGLTERAPLGGRGGHPMARFFGDDLRRGIFRAVPTAGMPTFREVVDRATWIERE